MLANFRSYGWTLAVGLGALLAEAVVAQESTLDLGDPAISIVTPMLEPIDPTLVDADATLELDRETARAVVAPVSEDARPKCVPVAGPAAIKVVADKEAATECKRLADAPPTIVGPDGVPVAIVATPAKPQLELRLKERRFELDKRAADLDLQQSLLDAAEKKLDEKIAAFTNLQSAVTAAVGIEAAEQMRSLSRIYEDMKPADAAVIFDEMPRDLLMALVKSMNPRKVAPILAKMRPSRASDLTRGLAVATD
ncbi:MULTISPECIES: hypothetical protein [unclassified Devosia]|mgnify:CR=1 FL=1|uniref:MotE family protein n=1 Tax=unclassified Devosia TaxID=196773 RepID=UPI00086986D9|nr:MULTISPECIES: hypothetical protein [unclassified Devosia]MBN9360715.1 hypothetical protein [Devosia sp.]ODS87907.1 MAG: hypothetical protein ABS47_11010 [Devosia sp. SCN 66-27]OJX22683.1 MAG: hypothetical protein BGO83_17985 [Devosia sp. 66-14]